MKFTIEIDTDNAAIVDNDPGEVIRILRDYCDRCESSGQLMPLNLRDINGNTVGGVNFSDEND